MAAIGWMGNRGRFIMTTVSHTTSQWLSQVLRGGNSGRSRRCAIAGRSFLALVGLLLVIIDIEIVLVDVVDDLVGNVVADTLAALAEESDLGRGNIVLDQLRDDPDIIPVLLKAYERIICHMSVLPMAYRR